MKTSLYSPSEQAANFATELADMRTKLELAESKIRSLTVNRVAVTRDSLPDTLRAMNRAQSTERDPHKAGTIYCRDIKPLFEDHFVAGDLLRARTAWEDVFTAANTLGTLNGTLVALRSLDLLKYELPILSRITTDFSDDPVKFNQAIDTRLRGIPAVNSYVAPAAPYTVGYSDSNVTDTDVQVTINNHKFCQIAYTANDLASTARLLFPEQEEGMHYALGLDMLNGLTALMTAANFTGPQSAAAPGYGNQAANPGTVCALDQFARPTVIAMKTALNLRGVTGGVRTLLLQELYHGQLETDTTVVGNLINVNAGDSIAQGRLPIIAGFKPLEAPYLPTNGINLQGFGFRKDALVMATRMPNDYSKVFPGVDGGGLVQKVTNPDTGMSVMLVMFIDHNAGTARMRLAWMWGAAVGNPAAGQLLTSQ